MGRSKEEMEGVTLLGNKDVKYSMDYAPEMLQTFDNKHPDNDYFVKFNCPEFTSLCPITGQPDFATVYISYVPGEKMVESKSLKLYLFSFRNHGDFHEDCMNIIMKDLIKLMDPKYIEVWGIPEALEHLEKLQQSGNLLLSIINNVLDMARIALQPDLLS